jgi:superfamily II DNA/RNA helicase
MPGPERRAALAGFTAPGPGRRCLVLSGVGARGLDLPSAHAAVLLDGPGDWRQYAHRAGRVGRMGAKGVVLSVVTPSEARALGAIGARLGVQLSRAEFRGRSLVAARAVLPAHRDKGECRGRGGGGRGEGRGRGAAAKAAPRSLRS